MSEDGDRQASFSNEFDDQFDLGPEEGNSAFFGRDVLRGLVDGIDDFIKLRQPRWRQFRAIGPALLGSAMWINDDELITKLGELSAACIVVTKQGRKPNDLRKLEPLNAVNERMPGIPIRALAGLEGLAPKLDGKPMIVGPYDRIDDRVIPTVRTLGYRRLGDLAPIMHAKLAILGHLWWHDEGPLGHVEDVIGFTPRRLWVSSANFTSSSRRNLEFGYWTEDDKLVRGAERFLVKAIAASEGLNPEADVFEPELGPIDQHSTPTAGPGAGRCAETAWAVMPELLGPSGQSGPAQRSERSRLTAPHRARSDALGPRSRPSTWRRSTTARSSTLPMRGGHR